MALSWHPIFVNGDVEVINVGKALCAETVQVKTIVPENLAFGFQIYTRKF